MPVHTYLSVIILVQQLQTPMTIFTAAVCWYRALTVERGMGVYLTFCVESMRNAPPQDMRQKKVS